MANEQTRRRGSALEAAILQVAWEQLNQVGYAALTMGQVAKLAGTNKNAIYRRWPNKSRLVMACMQPHSPELQLEVPLTKDLRTDLIRALGALIPIFEVTSSENIKGLVSDSLIDRGSEAFLTAINGDNLMYQQVQRVLSQFSGLDHLTARQRTLPAILIINDILQTGTLTVTGITQIVDEILVPLYQKAPIK